jgi:hypothetical protein
MADSLQLKNHAFRLCLAVGLPSLKDHANAGFALAAEEISRTGSDLRPKTAGIPLMHLYL